MSFEAFDPKNKDVILNKEPAQYKTPEKWIDGADVGGNTPQDSIDKNEVNDEQKAPEKKPIASLAEMGDQNTQNKIKLSKAVQDNPDWPPKSKNPESAAAENIKLENSLNAIV